MERLHDAHPQLASCFWCGGKHLAEHPLAVCAICAARFTTLRLPAMQGSYALDAAPRPVGRRPVPSPAQRLAR